MRFLSPRVLLLCVVLVLSGVIIWQVANFAMRYRGEPAGDVFRYGVDDSSAHGWNMRNVTSGWVFSEATDAPVQVTLLADGVSVRQVQATRERRDVAAAFPLVERATFPGFEFVLSMREYPHGRYHSRLRFEDDKGNVAEIDAPMVENAAPLGKALAQSARMLNPEYVDVRVWAWHPSAIAHVEVAGVALEHQGEGVLPPDFTYPLFPDNTGAMTRTKGSMYAGRVPAELFDQGYTLVQAEVTAKDGSTGRVPVSLLWRGDVTQKQPKARCAGMPFTLYYPVGNGFFEQQVDQLLTLQQMLSAPCVHVGVRARVEYLRTTKGAEGDYQFDADFSRDKLKAGGKEMSGMALNALLALAKKHQLPLMITLDGGVWADSKFPSEWDAVDYLEQDAQLVQWNEQGHAPEDDALSDLPGSHASPQLARMMTLNHANTRYRTLKQRNLQAAVRIITQWQAENPQLDVRINLDPDQYINPWFFGQHWFDYNPHTIAQFKDWLENTGIYAKTGSLYGQGLHPATTAFEPPRGALDGSKEYQLWIQFKRHLVATHTADLARWAHEAGMAVERIYTSQGVNESSIAIAHNDSAQDWTDQSGSSLQGAVSPHAQLGVILYGKTARNEGLTRRDEPLFAQFRALSPAWGVVEMHPATLAFADTMPSAAIAYNTMQQLGHYGAVFLSPMWGGLMGDQQVNPEHFRAYDVMEGSPFEYALFDWLHESRDVPVGGVLYAFGNAQIHSDDGWLATHGTLRAEDGVLHITPDTSGDARITLPALPHDTPSPQWLTLIFTHNAPAVTLNAIACERTENQARCRWKGAESMPVLHIKSPATLERAFLY